MKLKIYITLLLALTITASAQLSMPKVFGNHMVLQRDTEIPVWGKAMPGSEVTVQFDNKQMKVLTGVDGKWMVHLPQCKAGGPVKLVVFQTEKPGQRIEYDDILIGDVWLASGQSNMELQVQQAKDAKVEIINADYPKIRFFNVPHQKSVKPETELIGGFWKVCDSLNIKTASAVAYYFARKIHRDLNIPIGILQTTWGGTPVEAWTSREMLLSSPISRNAVLKNDAVTPGDFVKDSLDLIRFWDIVYHPKNNTDQIIPLSAFDDSSWKELDMPKTFPGWGIPPYEGMVWLRKTIELPEYRITNNLTLNLGHPEMNYSLYFNGHEICKTVWNASPTHSYTIPVKYVQKGKNTISVRMAVLWGGGGFNPPAGEMYLTDGNAKISLAGNWKYRKDLEPVLPTIHNYHYYPGFLFNAMINPVIPYGLKGFIWYQGEANDSLAYNYRTLFPMMITDWRIRWQQCYLPFLYIQLPNYKKRQAAPMESEWAELREAQAMTLFQPKTGMVCTIDLGEAESIHPLNKQDVGCRLALQAEKIAYGKELIASGPLYCKYRIENNTIRISFSNMGSGLKTTDNLPPREFTIAGEDKKFYTATAQIQQNEIIVSSDKVTNPVAVRYAWSDNPGCNTINAEGFPAVPFRTDQWKGKIQNKGN